jgi:ribosomal protein S6--L-glutamate ligase
MDVLHCLQRAGVEVLNPPRTLETAIDKYLATARLERAGLPVPPTWVGQGAEEAMEAFTRLGGDVVIKPLFGSEGRGLMRVSDESLMWRTSKALAQLGAVLYLQKFIHHPGYDIRILLLGERSLAVRRSNPADWRTNVSRGARAEPHVPSAAECDLARRAAEVLDAPLAGVDLLPDREGRLYVIELNAVPGWRGLAAALRQDVSALVLDFVERRVTARRDGRLEVLSVGRLNGRP